MALYQVIVQRDGQAMPGEPLRAMSNLLAVEQLQLRLARADAGDVLILLLDGVEKGRAGPRRT